MASAKLPRVRLLHILENIEGILAETRHLSDEEVVGSYVVSRAVERSIQINSEAAKELPPELRQREPDIPWKDIIGIGNLLRHEYYRIQPRMMLTNLRISLPALSPAVRRLIEALERED